MVCVNLTFLLTGEESLSGWMQKTVRVGCIIVGKGGFSCEGDWKAPRGDRWVLSIAFFP